MRDHGNHFTLDVPADAGMARTIGAYAIQVPASAEKAAITDATIKWPLESYAKRAAPFFFVRNLCAAALAHAYSFALGFNKFLSALFERGFREAYSRSRIRLEK
jgi:hypothetical protein